jgi:hypothetical protein
MFRRNRGDHAFEALRRRSPLSAHERRYVMTGSVVPFPRGRAPGDALEPLPIAHNDTRPGRLAFQCQDSRQTLAEGLDEYYRANAGRVKRPADLPADSAALFRSHDMCHVIFGLSTAPDDEALVDTRTMLSCDVGVARYLAYLGQDSEAKAIFKQFGYLRSVRATILAYPGLATDRSGDHRSQADEEAVAMDAARGVPGPHPGRTA